MAVLIDRIFAETKRAVRRMGLNGTPTVSEVAAAAAQSARMADYDLRDQILAGTVYQPGKGGSFEKVLRSIGQRCGPHAKPIIGYYNPVPSIVSCYQNALAGQWGKELTLEDEVNGKRVAPALADPLGRLWRWSNLDTVKSEIVELAANQGTVGLRVVYQQGPPPRIFLKYDHPRRIKDIDFDQRGNVTQVLLEYDLQYSPGLGTAETPITIRELISKDGFSVMVGGNELLPAEQQDNPLGVCPYVLLCHDRKPGDVFGRHAYQGSERPIHGINWQLSQLDAATAQAIRATWFFTGAGNKPDRIELDELVSIYVKTMAGVPQPTATPIVPQLKIEAALKSVESDIALLRQRQPELVLNDLTLLSGLSGETLQQVVKPAEICVRRARALYEDALRRALQIGLSVGILNALPDFNLGTGTGTKEAADRAYDDGQGVMQFAFKERDALPLTPAAAINKATANEAEMQARANTAKSLDGIVSRRYILEQVLKLPPKEVTKVLQEQAEQDTLTAQQDGTDPAQPAAA